MYQNRFDDLTRALAGSTSRRQALKLLGGSLLAALVPGSVLAGGGNSDCAHFCTSVFPPGPERGKCTSDAAKGKGVCYTCGPKSDGSQRLCGTTCIDSTHPCNGACPSGSKLCNGTCIPNDQCCGGCASGQICQNGTCEAGCPSGKVLLSNGSCATPCTAPGDPCGSCGGGFCNIDASGAIYCLNPGVPGNGRCSTDSNCPQGYFCISEGLCASLC